MASEHVADAEQSKPLEEKITDLKLEEKAGLVADAAREFLDGAEGAANAVVEQVKTDCNVSAENDPEASKGGEEKLTHDSSSREVQIALKEMQQSPDEGAYVVPTVDHRSVTEAGSEEKKVDVPTAVVHENTDPVDKSQQQGKGIIQSVTGKITSSVKSVFSSFSGGKAGKNAEAKTNETAE